MPEIIHTSNITITLEEGPTRKAIIEGFSEPVYYGVHGGIKKFYGLEPKKEHAATLDHIIGGVGGWMMGTLAAVLASKNISASQENYRSKVKGEIENVDGALKITRIYVHYFLKVREDQKKDAENALEQYMPLCPGAQSVIGCIDLDHEMSFE